MLQLLGMGTSIKKIRKRLQFLDAKANKNQTNSQRRRKTHNKQYKNLVAFETEELNV